MKIGSFLKHAAFALLATASLTLVGCEQDSPLQVSDDIGSLSRPTAVTASGKTIHFLGSNQGAMRLNKIVKKEQYIRKSRGGRIELDLDNNDLEIEFELTIPANSLDESKTISLSYDTNNYEGFTSLDFGPHGTQFSTPALLDVEIEGLDLTGVDPNTIKLYYINTNGQWEEMEVGSIKVDFEDNEIEVENAKIPHFSRYGVAAD